ncbi:hypothetical protein KFK09_016365 [Dendrobium nobile]|uniref:Uncharacterized protein n=1 Tax=Dendrobium nobile TaxID=94219 RepID=A0A8T3AZ90_DENNO|nr:hypothetical protein KFK09_016365 [Dendrobium nobile]
MIQRSKLAEELRDYQIRSQRKYWVVLSCFSAKPQISTRQDIAKAILWGFLFLLLVLSFFLSLRLKFHKLSALCIFLGILLPTCLWISRQRQLAKKRERRMLLPLSM